MTEKLMLIDANSLLYRAFFALPPLENSAGQPTGAVYGFINMLMKLLEDYPVDYAVAAFDLPGPTKRTEEYKEYKAHRPSTPPELRSQMAIARDVLDAMGIVRTELAGFEADDLVGTVAKLAAQHGCFSWIVSGDRDILQVVDPSIHVILTQKGISQTKVYDEEAVRERYQVSPIQLVDIKGLMGDTSDNIPGVPGIGEKTAIKLISQYGSVSGVYDNIQDLKGKMRENLEQNQELAVLSKKLALIDIDAPIPIQWPPEKMVRDNKKMYDLFKGLEFNTLLERLDLGFDDFQAVRVEKVSDPARVLEIFSQDNLSVLLGDQGLAAAVDDIALIFEGDGLAAAYEGLEQFVAREQTRLITDDAKLIYRFALDREVSIKSTVHSCQLAAYLLKPGSSLDLPGLVRAWTDKGVDPEQHPKEEYLLAHVGLLPQLWSQLELQLQETGSFKLYKEIELPLSQVLARMEKTGIAVDVRELETIGAQLKGKILSLQEQIHLLADCEFNINSPKQLGEVLFDKMCIPPVRKTKTGYSTDASVLEFLSDSHEIVPLIIDYRQLVKLQSTYIEGLKGVWKKDTGRIYTTFNQMVTATGRLSSTEPNLQNIPIRLEEGRRIRKAFIPGGGYRWLLAADYSQIELRILAHIAQEETLIEAFREGQDIHSRTAAEIFRLPIDQVTPDQRRAAKAVNFGLVYGQTDFGLSRGLGISKGEAAEYIEAYFNRYPGVKIYMDKVITEARKNGYVSTMFDRRRYLPEIGSRNFQRRSFAERTAINTPIQGTAADIIKLAMVEVARRLDAEGLVSRMLLQVHDELVLETTEDELKRAAQLVRTVMEQVANLDVPLVVDVKSGSNWYTLEPLKD